MLEKPYQPSLVYVSEKALDVCFQYVVDLPAHNGIVDIPHNVMCTTVRSEPVGAVQKPRFIDLRMYVGHNLLHKPVFTGGYSERPLFSVGLRYIDPSHWLRDVFKRLEALNEAKYILGRFRLVVLLTDAINTHGLAGRHAFMGYQ